jgi:UDP-N-acetyl-2-amino-2-deoxyglucuronate dehydrogenase
MNIGLIGGGNISSTHARAALAIPGVKITAVYGTNEDKVNRLSGDSGAKPYDEFERFLTHRPMDMVVIGSPSGLHASQGIAAARQGLHVLVEKPIDITLDRADALISVCQQAGVKLGVIFQDRFKADICRLRQFIQNGSLGKPLLVDARVKWYRPPEYYRESRWRGTWALDGGGALMNQGVHTVDLLLWLLGDAKCVQAQTANLQHEIETEDTALALLEFSSGPVGTLYATTAAYPGYPRRVEITGTEGTVVLEQDRIIRADLRRESQELIGHDLRDENPSDSSPVVSDVRGHQRAIEDFIRAVEDDRTPRCDGAEGRRSLALIEEIYRVSGRSSHRSSSPLVLT